jgi:hypothetical protein
MKMRRFAIAALLAAYAAPAFADTTPWMTKVQTDQLAATSKRDQWAPTAIECQQGLNGPQFRLTTQPFTMENKPFHKWNWVEGKASRLERLVAKLKRSDRRDLKYRIVASATYKNARGAEHGCAIAFR